MNQLFSRTCIRLLAVLSLLTLSACSSTPYLMDLVQAGNTSAVQSQLRQGAYPDATNDFGKTALHLAAQRDEVEAARLLIDAGAKPDRRTTGKWTALHYATRYDASPAMLTLLIEAGADVNAQANSQWTPLHYAARYSKPQQIEMLLAAGARVDPRTNANYTPLFLSLYREKTTYTREIADLLLQADASLDIRSTGKGATTLLTKASSVALVSNDYLVNRQAELAAAAADAELAQRLDSIRSRDASLNPRLKRDKYMVAFTGALKDRDYATAHIYASLLDEVPANIDPAFHYYWGETLLELGQAQAAIDKLQQYLKEVGPSGKHYTAALQMLLKAESHLDS